MAHIHTDSGQHDFTASAYIVRLDTPKPSLMMHRHKILKQYLQFGGHVELHETPWQTVTHEIAEESGYDMRQLALLQPKQRLAHINGAVLHPAPVALLTHQFGKTEHYHTDIAYAFVAHEAPSGQAAEGESQEFHLLTAKQLADLPKGSIPENVRDTGLFVLTECIASWKQVKTQAFAI